MSSEHRLNELESEVQRLEEAFRAGQTATRRASRATLAIATSLGLVVVAFVIANFFNMKSEWTEEKFSASLTKELEELKPTAEAELKKLGSEVLPVYMKEGRSQIDRMSPEMADRFDRELDLLCRDITQGVHDRLQESQRRVMLAVEKAIFESFPDLGDEVKQELLERRFRAETEQSLAKALNKFNEKFGARVKDFESTLVTFDVSNTGENSVDLQKKFISLWLDLLKQEIMEL